MEEQPTPKHTHREHFKKLRSREYFAHSEEVYIFTDTLTRLCTLKDDECEEADSPK